MNFIDLITVSGGATSGNMEVFTHKNNPDGVSLAIGIGQDSRNIPLRDYLEIVSVIDSYSRDVKSTFWD